MKTVGRTGITRGARSINTIMTGTTIPVMRGTTVKNRYVERTVLKNVSHEVLTGGMMEGFDLINLEIRRPPSRNSVSKEN